MTDDVDRQAAWWQGLQPILNAHDVPDRYEEPAQPVPVTARVVWGTDGEEHLETVAMGWTRRLALILVDDRRSQLRGVWVPVEDVRRR